MVTHSVALPAFIFFFIPTHSLTHYERGTFSDDVPYGQTRRTQTSEGNVENKARDLGTA